MALNARNVPKAGGKNTPKQEPMEPGTYPARIVQVIDCGLQPQRPFEGQEKPPAYTIMLTYEFLDEFCKTEEGEDDLEKPRWLGEEFPLRNLEADLAKSTKRYKTLDPNMVHEGDFGALVDAPCLVTVVNTEGKGKNKGKIYNNVGAVSAMRPRDAANAPSLVNDAKVFTLDEPNIEVFLSFPEWIQDKLKANLEYEGSALQKALAANGKAEDKPKAEPEEKQEEAEDETGDDIPW